MLLKAWTTILFILFFPYLFFREIYREHKAKQKEKEDGTHSIKHA